MAPRWRLFVLLRLQNKKIWSPSTCGATAFISGTSPANLPTLANAGPLKRASNGAWTVEGRERVSGAEGGTLSTVVSNGVSRLLHKVPWLI